MAFHPHSCHRGVLATLFGCLVSAASLSAQTTARCEIPRATIDRTPTTELKRRLIENGPNPIWIADGNEGVMTLSRLAGLASPVLWFSPREFLLLERANHGREAPPNAVPADRGDRLSRVYFRIRAVRLKEDDEGRTTDVDGPSVRAAIQDHDRPWDCAGLTLPLRQLDRVTIRYFFYYIEDRGVGSHFDDLEAVELQLRLKWVCRRASDAPEIRVAQTAEEAQRKQIGECFEAIVVESVAASAHGVGWYTNVLETSRAADTLVPLTLLVEENKHASAPDRDGDGLYMPRYDVNKYTNDAWGLRDTAGTGRLGDPAYAADQTRITRPVRPASTRMLPEQYLWSDRLIRAFGNATGRPESGRPTEALGYYDLTAAWQSAMCVDGEVDEERAREGAAAMVRGYDGRKLIGFARKQEFCAPPSRMRVRGSGALTVQRFSDALSAIYPGPRNQYGFMRWPQRFALSYRNDHGQGVSFVGPVLPGTEMPLFGGWIVGKVNYIPETNAFDLGRVSLSALYTPSASQAVGWYLALGHEWRSLNAVAGAGQGDARVSNDPQRSSGTVQEVGVKFRFSLEWMPIAKFWGARIGVRSEGTRPVRNPRLVFELGAGSW